MRPHQEATDESSDTDSLEATARRRRMLEHLQKRSSSMSERELAARVASDDPGPDVDAAEEPAQDVDTAEAAIQDLHVLLRHVDLPKVEAAGLVAWDAAEGTVAPIDDSSLSETEVRQLFADGWDDEAAVSRHERRQVALDVLSGTEGELHLNDLAAEVAAHESAPDAEPSESDVDEVGVALHHRHLPRLSDAGLAEYDPTEGTVAYRGPAEPERRNGSDSPARSGSTDRDDGWGR